MIAVDREPDELPAEPLDYRAGWYYTLRFVLVVGWLGAAFLVVVGAAAAYGKVRTLSWAERLQFHDGTVVALNVLLGVQVCGALALWRLRRRPGRAAALAVVTAVLALATIGLRTPPTRAQDTRPEPVPPWTGCVSVSGGRNTCPGG
ncbi:hypothetical protein [Catellatospora citrea]|uniref:Uncharacterized protein n=1 Tax=Catellatospora citrea TaxID=53366 RepID=A0A8J3KJ91_9ACTN|nr:hypothetical protein [Catellatospora citrea]RKE06367.1 hypothetical protein C8E86_1187 [Catellatospora citrea]GIG01003.1 hypothetical protein Cci01nite_60960 [Catellatospora citrea]